MFFFFLVFVLHYLCITILEPPVITDDTFLQVLLTSNLDMTSMRPFPCQAALCSQIMTSLYILTKCCFVPRAHLLLYSVVTLSGFSRNIRSFMLPFLNESSRKTSTNDWQVVYKYIVIYNILFISRINNTVVKALWNTRKICTLNFPLRIRMFADNFRKTKCNIYSF